MQANNRKPHLHRVKQEIVHHLDSVINHMIKRLADKDPGFEKEDQQHKRDLAIWIRQRNRLAKEADIAEIPLNSKDGQGKYTIEVEG